MCLTMKFFDKKKVATEDIIVYKGLCPSFFIYKTDYFETPFQHSLVKLGETYSSELKSYFDISCFKFVCEVGLHSVEFPEDVPKGRIVKCIIPKGSYYYKGKFASSDSYASDTIKYVEFLSNTEY